MKPVHPFASVLKVLGMVLALIGLLPTQQSMLMGPTCRQGSGSTLLRRFRWTKAEGCRRHAGFLHFWYTRCAEASRTRVLGISGLEMVHA